MRNPEHGFSPNTNMPAAESAGSVSEYQNYISKMEQDYPAIDLDSFAGLPQYKDLDLDIKRVANRKKDFERVNTPEQAKTARYSRMFELMLSQRIELSNWLGDSASVIRTSDYDDIFNGVDMVVEFENEPGFFSNLGLAVDLTFSKKKIFDKIKDLKSKIDKNQLPTVKYFYSEKQQERKPLEAIPEVVIGTDTQTIDEIIGLIVRRGKLQKFKAEHPHTAEDTSKKIREINHQLDNHPYQIELLQQIRLEAVYAAKYAEKTGKQNIADRYRVILRQIEAILADKSDLIAEDQQLGREKRMLQEIKDNLDPIFRV